MVLDKTVDMMLSDDYKEQIRAEYHQVVYRANKLQKAIKEYDPKKPQFKASIDLLKWHHRVLMDYIYVLKVRANIEKIKL